MRQIIFALEDIKRRKNFYIRFFIQITCVLILFGVCVSQLSSLNNFTHKFDIFENLSQMYIVRDDTNDEIINQRLSKDDIEEKLFKFYNFLISSDDLNFYTYFNQDISIESNKELDIKHKVYPDNINRYSLISVNSDFMETFNLSTSKGRIFSEIEFATKNNLTPVILGHAYNQFYELGDIINDQYSVIGILNKSNFYLDPGKTDEIMYLDDFIIAPLIVNNETPYTKLDSIITSSTLITNNPLSLQKIKDMSKSIELYDEINFISFSQQLENIVKSYMTLIYFSSLIQIMILFFCLICIITSLINFIDSHRREFAIHILCGAKISDLIYRIAFQIFIILATANIITLFIFKFTLSTLGINAISVFMLIIIMVFPVIKIKKQQLSDYLRGE